MTQQDPRVTRAAPAGRNPLRRRIDDIESAVLTGLVIFFFVAAPVLCVITGGLADSAAAAQRRAERYWHPVTATLQQSAASGLIGLDGEWGASWVSASWRNPDGGTGGGLIAVGLNARAGQHLTVWLTGSGQLTRPRLSAADVRDRVASAVLATAAGVALALAIVAGVVRLIVGRRRLTYWARAWAAVAPRWSAER